MEIYTTSQARNNLFKLVDYTASSHDPVYIVSKKGKAVLISEEDYEAMAETLYLSSIPGMKESIIKSSKAKKEDFTDEIKWDEL